MAMGDAICMVFNQMREATHPWTNYLEGKGRGAPAFLSLLYVASGNSQPLRELRIETGVQVWPFIAQAFDVSERR